jgi:hypothetical protein
MPRVSFVPNDDAQEIQDLQHHHRPVAKNRANRTQFAPLSPLVGNGRTTGEKSKTFFDGDSSNNKKAGTYASIALPLTVVDQFSDSDNDNDDDGGNNDQNGVNKDYIKTGLVDGTNHEQKRKKNKKQSFTPKMLILATLFLVSIFANFIFLQNSAKNSLQISNFYFHTNSVREDIFHAQSQILSISERIKQSTGFDVLVNDQYDFFNKLVLSDYIAKRLASEEGDQGD